MPEQPQTAVAVRHPEAVIVQRTYGLTELEHMGRVFHAAGMFPNVQSVAQAVVKIMAGQELGLSPIESMMGVNVFNGRVSLSAEVMGKLIKKDPRYDYKVITLTNTECLIEFYEDGQVVGSSKFTMDDAKQAGLTGKDVWKSYPRNMLFARALSNGKRWFSPDAGPGVYTHEELGLPVNGEGEIIEGEGPSQRDPALTALMPKLVPHMQPAQYEMLKRMAEDPFTSNATLAETIVTVVQRLRRLADSEELDALETAFTAFGSSPEA